MRAVLTAFALAFVAFFPAQGSAMRGASLIPVPFSALTGWRQADHAAALAAFRRSCTMIERHGFHKKHRFNTRRADWLAACRAARRVKPGKAAARTFFERHFQPVMVAGNHRPAGLFTGYYEPEVEGCLKRTARCRWPLYAKPDDLVTFTPAERKRTGLVHGRRTRDGPKPYFSRREIEQGALKGRGLELVWLASPVDRFFMQVQGSGRVRLPSGRVLRLAYAAKSGLPYTSIGKVLLDRGVLRREDISMQSIRRWMARHPEEAREVMWQNRSFVFFRIADLPNPKLGAIGAGGVQLTPLVSLAVDWRFWPYGAPVWLDTRLGRGDGPVFRRLMVAQDTGTAIRGQIRGDIYFGFGERAARLAGRQAAPGRMIVLLPRAVARRSFRHLR